MVLEKVLMDLNAVEGVKGALVAGKDGLVIVQQVSKEIDAELASAMAAIVFSTGTRTLEELKQGELIQTMVEGSSGKILLVATGEAILAVITEPDMNLGLIRIVMKNAVRDIEAELSGARPSGGRPR